jgi:hypothetical protein
LLKLESTHMNPVRRLAVVLGCLFLLNGCGGGGGGGGSDNIPTTPTTPPVTPPPSAALTGSLWSSDSNISDTQGTFVSDLITGTTTKVNSDTEAMPSADGARLLRRAYTSDGSVGDATQITVVRTTDGQLLTDLTVDGYVGTLSPSPQAANLVLTRWAPSINDPRNVIVYDIDQRKVLFATPASGRPDAVSWMPDGSLLRVKPSGEITKVVLGAAEQAVRTLTWPEARVPQAVYVSPDGSKALVQLAALRETGSVSGVDLWMMNIDGSNLTRFTKNDLIAKAFWSPDSKLVAFIKDTGVSCTDATCQGSCNVWYAEATASDVVAVAASGDAKKFSVKRTTNGSVTTLSCPVMAWTR